MSVQMKTAGPACCCGCLIFADDFTVDQLDTKWTEAGTWSVDAGILTGNGIAVLIANKNAPAGITGVHLTVEIQLPGTGTTAQILLGQVDADNNWYLEVEAGDTDGTMKIFETVAGVAAQRGSTRSVPGFIANTWGYFCFSLFGEKAAAAGNGNGLEYDSGAAITVVDTLAGLVANSGSNILFDNFVWSRHFIDDPECPACDGELPNCTACEGGIAPSQYQVEFDNFGDGFFCNQCADGFGESYLLQFVAQFEDPISCLYGTEELLAFGDGINCGVFGFFMQIVIKLDGGVYTVTFNLVTGGGTTVASWIKSYGATAPDCINFVDEELDNVFSSLETSCVLVGSVARLTAV